MLSVLEVETMKELFGSSMEPYGWKESYWLSKGICGDGGYEWLSTPGHIEEDTILPQSPK